MAKEDNEDQILVVATASGFYAGIPREPGDQFRVPKKKLKSTWFVAVDKTVKAAKGKGAPKAEEPKDETVVEETKDETVVEDLV